MKQTALSFATTADFVAYTDSIEFGAFSDAVIVANGEVTGTFKDAKTAAALTPTKSLN
jgi:hypothetical protein